MRLVRGRIVLVGLACLLVVGVPAALAGSGVGGVFNLGVSNSVNAQTSLTGSTAAAQLQVTNTNAAAGAAGLGVNSASSTPTGMFANSSTGNGLSATSAAGIGVFAQSAGAATPALRARNTAGGPAAALTVNAGVAPFTVSSQTKVNGLNADLLDGFDVNQISRIGQASNQVLFNFAAPTTEATVTLTAPKPGFVLVQGSIVIEDRFAVTACNSCPVVVAVHDVSANVNSIQAFGSIGNGTKGSYLTIPVHWVFPVKAGSHSYALTAAAGASVGGPALIDNPVLTAEYIPFGQNGSPTILAADGQNTVATPTQSDRDGVSRGNP